MNIPEGVETVTVEGRDLKLAIAAAAEQLGLHPAQVDHKLDLSHFRSSAGVSLARSTVKIVAWNSGRSEPAPEELKKAPPAEAKVEEEGTTEVVAVEGGEERRKRPRKGRGESDSRPRDRERDRDRERERERDREPVSAKPDSLRGAEEGTTEASEYAQQWFKTLLERMSVEGTVTGTGSADRVHLSIKAERAGRIVGKRGATLGAIRHLLDLALEQKFGKLTIDVDVGDDRPAQEREIRSELRDRGDRGERDRGDRDRGDRDRGDRDRGDRDRDRGRGRGRPRGDQGRYPESKLKMLARRAAEKAIESGQTITIKLALNSFDRRIVHVEVSKIEGVESQSEERMGEDGRMVKYVQIIPLQD